jgi:hypothetical protein
MWTACSAQHAQLSTDRLQVRVNLRKTQKIEIEAKLAKLYEQKASDKKEPAKFKAIRKAELEKAMEEAGEEAARLACENRKLLAKFPSLKAKVGGMHLRARHATASEPPEQLPPLRLVG